MPHKFSVRKLFRRQTFYIVASFVVPIGIVVWPVLIELGKARETIFLPNGRQLAAIWVWVGFYVVNDLVRRVFGGRRVGQYRDHEARRADVLAGNVDEVGGLFAGRKMRHADSPSPERITAGLLQGVADVAASYIARPGAVVQAALIVPRERAGKWGRVVEYLKVRGYNQLAASRAFSEIELTTKDSPAVIAYESGRRHVAPDTTAEPYRNVFRHRPYKSVTALPVSLRCVEGKPLAIVTIDVNEANALTDELLDSGLERAIQPYLKLIGLIQLASQLEEKE